MKKMRLFYAVAMALFTLTFSSCDEDALQSLTGGGDDTVAALKEALTIGAQVASNKLGAENGYLNDEKLVPCTVKAVIKLLEEYNVALEGANVVIVGRGNIVGKPLSLALLNRNATVTIAHSKTANLKEVTKKADILAVAIGKPKFITADMVKKDAVVIDIGINRVAGKMCGDVDFDSVCNVASYISPVPGGVGPVTTAILLQNVIKCYKEQKMKKN